MSFCSSENEEKNDDETEKSLELRNKALSGDSFNPLIMVFDTIGKHIMRTVKQASNRKNGQKNYENFYGKY